MILFYSDLLERGLKNVIYLTQYGYVIDEVVIGLGPNETIAETGFTYTDLAFVLFGARHTDNGYIELFHGGEWAELEKGNKNINIIIWKIIYTRK